MCIAIPLLSSSGDHALEVQCVCALPLHKSSNHPCHICACLLESALHKLQLGAKKCCKRAHLLASAPGADRTHPLPAAYALCTLHHSQGEAWVRPPARQCAWGWLCPCAPCCPAPSSQQTPAAPPGQSSPEPSPARCKGSTNQHSRSREQQLGALQTDAGPAQQ